MASPRGWLALHPLGLWSGLEPVLSLTLKLQASAVPKSDLSVFRVQKPLVRLPPHPRAILRDTQALPGLQVAVTFKKHDAKASISASHLSAKLQVSYQPIRCLERICPEEHSLDVPEILYFLKISFILLQFHTCV